MQVSIAKKVRKISRDCFGINMLVSFYLYLIAICKQKATSFSVSNSSRSCMTMNMERLGIFLATAMESNRIKFNGMLKVERKRENKEHAECG